MFLVDGRTDIFDEANSRFSQFFEGAWTKLEVVYVEHGRILWRMLRLYQSCGAEEEEEGK